MKATFILLLALQEAVIAMPSLGSANRVPMLGPRLERRYMGRAAPYELFGRDDNEACTTEGCRKCDNCDPMKCRYKQYRDKQDCKCKKCPTGTKPDLTRTACLPEKPNNDGDKKSKEKKESKWEETKKRMKEKWDTRKKKEQSNEEERKKKEQEDGKDRKKERMGKCLPLVASSMVSVGAGIKRADDQFKYATDFFSEDYIDSEDIMSLWPQGWSDAPTTNIDSEEYVNEFLKAIDSPSWITSASPGSWTEFKPPKKRGDEFILPPPELATSTEVVVVRGETGIIIHEKKRFVKALFTQIGKFFGAIGKWLAGNALRRLKDLKSQGGLRIAEKGKGAAYKDQKWAGGQITKSKNWKNCLNGKAAEKY
ncbi:hypothetical protein CC86DRAFT_421084 [Ophiobolus disseminans]|uniref:Uncharacterized protein n=1 Tax=Ophiobolus disseminans TaxID=1469910 RepID=A0A6A6ZUM8_9PLEO|nr:hypothetical protein CC86DRAFT_421084 [Ophiobolus disseminans]